MDLENKKILVTGGAGFIGSHLVEKLLESNEVTIFDRTPGIKKPDPRAGVIDGNLMDREFVVKNVKGFDFVFHLAANPNPQENAYEQNVQMTKNILSAMALNGISALGFASSVLVYGDAETPTNEESQLKPKSPYGISKSDCESLIASYCSSYAMRAWIFRLANVCGAGLTHGPVFDFIRKLRDNPNELEVLGDGSQSRCYIYIDDCIDGILKALALDDAVNVINIGSADSIPISRIAEIAAEVTGTKPKITFTGRSWPGDVKATRPDISKARSLGFSPKYLSEQAVRAALGRISAF